MFKSNKVLLSLVIIGLGSTLNSDTAFAQSGPPAHAPGGGGPQNNSFSASSAGSDMWIGLATQRRLFAPHSNDCQVGSETFVEIGASGLGFCIENSERPSLEWEDAREACLKVNKRLPEVAEWKFTCKYYPSVPQMLNNFEWTSNFSETAKWNAEGAFDAVVQVVPVMGEYNRCDTISQALVGGLGTISFSGNPAHAQTLPFRCVR